MITFRPSPTIKYEVQRFDPVICLISTAGSQTEHLYASDIRRLGMLIHATEIIGDAYAWRAAHIHQYTRRIQYA